MKEHEEKVRIFEEEIIMNNTDDNRAKLHAVTAEYIRHMKLEEAVLKQKAQRQ